MKKLYFTPSYEAAIRQKYQSEYSPLHWYKRNGYKCRGKFRLISDYYIKELMSDIARQLFLKIENN